MNDMANDYPLVSSTSSYMILSHYYNCHWLGDEKCTWSLLLMMIITFHHIQLSKLILFYVSVWLPSDNSGHGMGLPSAVSFV